MSFKILVFSSLFPSAESPTAGLFIRERMLRVNERHRIVVLAPQFYSPVDWIIRLFRKDFRRLALRHELIGNIEIHRPIFLSIPGTFKSLDGFFMALGSRKITAKIVKDFCPDLIDAHFAYPDGYAASKLAHKFKLPLTITLRGSKDAFLIGTPRQQQMSQALSSASTVITVSDELVQSVAIPCGVAPGKIVVVGNGVDLQKFQRMPKDEARRRLNIENDTKVIVSVGTLIESKGFHRLIDLLPAVRQKFGKVKLLIVGGAPSQNKNVSADLVAQANELGVRESVVLCGRQSPEELKWFYSAADVFALATSFEGWANVFLESMACGTPVVTTDVGGNPQVVSSSQVGVVVPYWKPELFLSKLIEAIEKDWETGAIQAYARSNSWDQRIDQLSQVFRDVIQMREGSQ